MFEHGLIHEIGLSNALLFFPYASICRTDCSCHMCLFLSVLSNVHRIRIAYANNTRQHNTFGYLEHYGSGAFPKDDGVGNRRGGLVP